MQTFMTRNRFGKTGTDLDNARLGKQMVECRQIFDTVTGVTPKFYPNHPAMKMWTGYEFALGIYAMMLNMEWTFNRGFASHKTFRWFGSTLQEMRTEDPEFSYEAPPWLNDSAVLLSHRSNLIRKDSQYYGTKWKNAPENWPYIWPIIDFDREDGYELRLSQADKKRIATGERAKPDEETLERIVNWP